jgi:hypothetical protein
MLLLDQTRQTCQKQKRVQMRKKTASKCRSEIFRYFQKKKKSAFSRAKSFKKKTQKVPLRDIKKRPRHRYLLKNERLRD